MYTFTSKYDVYVPFLSQLYKKCITHIFLFEINKKGIMKCKDVKEYCETVEHNYTEMDFRFMVVSLKKAIKYLNFFDTNKKLYNDENKQLYKIFLQIGLNLRNEVWHSLIQEDKPENYLYYCDLFNEFFIMIDGFYGEMINKEEYETLNKTRSIFEEEKRRREKEK